MDINDNYKEGERSNGEELPSELGSLTPNKVEISRASPDANEYVSTSEIDDLREETSDFHSSTGRSETLKETNDNLDEVSMDIEHDSLVMYSLMVTDDKMPTLTPIASVSKYDVPCYTKMPSLTPIEETLIENGVGEKLMSGLEPIEDGCDNEEANALPLPQLKPLNDENEMQVDDGSELERLLKDNSPMPELIPLPSSDDPSPMRKMKEALLQHDIENFLKSSPSPPTQTSMMESSDHENSFADNKSLNSSSGSSSRKTSIVDSLLQKIGARKTSKDSSGSDVSRFQQMLSDPEDDLLVEFEPPVPYSKSKHPNALPTPIVENQKSISAFVNNEEEYRKTVAKHQPKKLLATDSVSPPRQPQVPTMKAPEIPTVKPRTLAEKRQLMNSNNFKILMVNKESKIYKQVQRKKQQLPVNYDLLDSMLTDEIPINPGPWKVLTFLRTREGRSNYLYLKEKDQTFKLNGSRGNHAEKFLPELSTDPFPRYQISNLRSVRCCPGGRIKKRDMDVLVYSKSIRQFVLEGHSDNNDNKIMDNRKLDNQLTSIKPRPLAMKIEALNKDQAVLLGDEDCVFLGKYSKFEMPDIKLEVKIHPKMSLEPTVKKYLNSILPHRDMNENWCHFALTSLPTKYDDEVENKETFEFTIPYHDNKKNILVREIKKAKEDNESLRIGYEAGEEEDADDMEWTFAKDADPNDPLECEVIDVIKDLTNSVFLNLNDNLFSKDDPDDRKTPSLISPLKSKEAMEQLSSTKLDKNKKILMELKKLNANVFKTQSSCVDNEDDMRRHATAHLGKVERELRPTVILTESETVLLGNQEKESRRIKRVPKKFSDYNTSGKLVASEDEKDEQPPAKKPKLRQNNYENDCLFAMRGKYPELNHSYEELKTVKQEIRKMLHVSVDLHRLRGVDSIESWCMVHNLYRCQCKGVSADENVFTLKPFEAPKLTPKASLNHPSGKINLDTSKLRRELIDLQKSRERRPETVASQAGTFQSARTSDLKLFNDPDDGPEVAQRVLPFTRCQRIASKRDVTMQIRSDNLPKIEILNLNDLINGGIGPIYINVFDDKSTRINIILRSVLNNRCAVVYLDHYGYYINKDRIKISSINFQAMEKDVNSPIFVIQAKDNVPPPVSSTNHDDFIKNMFCGSDQTMTRIEDRTVLNDVGNLVESILLNVRKKLVSKLGENADNEVVKEQLKMLTRKRSRSTSSVSTSISSANSSPLSFHGQRLTEAPPPGLKSPQMKEFNNIFTQRMNTIVRTVAFNTLGLKPSNELLNKIYIYKWSLFLQCFEEDLIHVWQVTLESEKDARYQLLVLTDSPEKPRVEEAKAENIVNIRSLTLFDNITELTRMILLRVENKKMKFMTILLYGCKGYMRIGGILNSNEDYLTGRVGKPRHPRLTAKIQKMYNIWYFDQKAVEKKHEQKRVETLWKFGRSRVEKSNELKIEPKRREVFVNPVEFPVKPPTPIRIEPVSQESHPVSMTHPKPVEEPEPNYAEPELAFREPDMSMNRIKEMGAIAMKTHSGQSDFKWFLFNVTDDFSDILIKSWNKCLPYHVIMKSIQRAKQTKRAVLLVPEVNHKDIDQPVTRKWPQIYALPSTPLKFREQESMTDNYLLVGPYMRKSVSNLLLMMNVEGELLLRDDFEKRKNIERKTRTRCLWIYANTLKCIHNAETKNVTFPAMLMKKTNPQHSENQLAWMQE